MCYGKYYITNTSSTKICIGYSSFCKMKIGMIYCECMYNLKKIFKTNIYYFLIKKSWKIIDWWVKNNQGMMNLYLCIKWYWGNLFACFDFVIKNSMELWF